MSPKICCVSDGMNETTNPVLPFCTDLSVSCKNSRTLHWQRGVSITGAPEKSLALHLYNLHSPLASDSASWSFRAFRTVQYFLDLMHYNVFNSSLLEQLTNPPYPFPGIIFVRSLLLLFSQFPSARELYLISYNNLQ